MQRNSNSVRVGQSVQMAIKFSKTFLLRKLHQITGIVPLGMFFFVHMFTNSKAMNGAASFDKAVKEIHDIPYLLLIEIFGIFLPLLFHSVYGILISAEAKPNVRSGSLAEICHRHAILDALSNLDDSVCGEQANS